MLELQRFSPSSVVDAFLLKNVERTAAAYPASAHDKLRELSRAARDRVLVADGLVDLHVPSALCLYREAALLHMAAFVVATTGVPVAEPLRAEEVLARFRSPDGRVPSCGPDKLAEFLELVRVGDPLAGDRLAPPAAVERGEAARVIVRWLGALVEPRSVAEIRFDRGVRLTVAALTLIVLLFCGIASLPGNENIALHKPVTVSGVNPHATSPPSGLTDGITSGTYGVHTNSGDFTWVQVDLQAVFEIKKVKIYNRGDGWFDDGLPMTLQFSENGKDYVTVEVRKTNFGQVIPWTADGGHKRARYVRVVGAKGRYVTLSELEVYGRKP